MAQCTSCGRTGEDTMPVRRVYLILPEGAPTDPTSIEDLADPSIDPEDEDWCATCREQFPHVTRT